jgi:hypothetical protein
MKIDDFRPCCPLIQLCNPERSEGPAFTRVRNSGGELKTQEQGIPFQPSRVVIPLFDWAEPTAISVRRIH